MKFATVEQMMYKYLIGELTEQIEVNKRGIEVFRLDGDIQEANRLCDYERELVKREAELEEHLEAIKNSTSALDVHIHIGIYEGQGVFRTMEDLTPQPLDEEACDSYYK